MDYFYGRPNLTGNLDEAVDALFKNIVDYFPKDWLEDTDSDHPLQLLWNRSDAISTWELVAFANALLKLRAINEPWLIHQIKIIKNDPSGREGAFFEILGLGMLCNDSGQIVNPANNNNPGIDGFLTMPRDKTLQLSLKRYKTSYKNKQFLVQCKNIEKEILSILKELGILAVQFKISAQNSYPSDSDFQMLIGRLRGLLPKHNFAAGNVYDFEGVWEIEIAPLAHKSHQFLEGYNSCTAIIISPYYEHEHKRIFDNIESACANIAQHAHPEDENTKNFVLIHLPTTASVVSCERWILEYYENFPDRPVSAVILYQPLMVVNLETGENYIQHTVKIVQRQGLFDDWEVESRAIMADFFGGHLTYEPAKVSLHIGDAKFDLEDKYVFQSGNHYLKANKEAGQESGPVGKVAPGIFEHVAIFPTGGKAGILLSGRHSPDDRLLIL